MRTVFVKFSAAIAFGFLIAKPSIGGTSVTIASTAGSVWSTAASSAARLTEPEKEEAANKMEKDFKSDDELVAFAETITDDHIANLEESRNEEGVAQNELLIKEIDKKIYFLDLVRARAEILRAENKALENPAI